MIKEVKKYFSYYSRRTNKKSLSDRKCSKSTEVMRMNKELNQMLENLRELEDARDEVELLSKYNKITDEASKKIGAYEGAFEMYKIAVNGVKLTVNTACDDIKSGKKSAIKYTNIGERTKNDADILLEEIKDISYKTAKIADQATAIKNRKLQEFKISN